jgi:hypothetical protein
MTSNDANISNLVGRASSPAVRQNHLLPSNPGRRGRRPYELSRLLPPSPPARGGVLGVLLMKVLRAIFRYDDTETLPCLLLWRPSGKRVKTEGPDVG